MNRLTTNTEGAIAFTSVQNNLKKIALVIIFFFSLLNDVLCQTYLINERINDYEFDNNSKSLKSKLFKGEVDKTYVRLNSDCFLLDSIFLNINSQDQFNYAIINSRQQREYNGAQYIVISGPVFGEDVGYFNFVQKNGLILNGYIGLPGRVYLIRYISNEVYELKVLDSRLIPDCGNIELTPKVISNFNIPFEAISAPDQYTSNLIADNGNLIDIMVVYTEDAENSVTDIEADIIAAIEDANISFINSNINSFAGT